MPALPKRQPGMVIYALVASKRARLRSINAGHIAPNLDDALGPKQHRISCETYPNAESAKASIFDCSVRWEEWAMDKGMAGNLIPERSPVDPLASVSSCAGLITGLDAVPCTAIVLARLCRAQALAGRWPAALRQSASGQTQFSTASIIPWGPMLKGAGK
jgi:hypothetical protein